MRLDHLKAPAQEVLRADSAALRKFFSEVLLCAPDDRPDLELLLFDTVSHGLARVPLTEDAVDAAVRQTVQVPTRAATLAVFGAGGPRQMENCRGFLGFFIDLDVQGDDHGRGFESERDLKACIEYLDRTVPPSLVTRTKDGRHLIYLFDELIDRDELVERDLRRLQRALALVAVGDTRSRVRGEEVSKARRFHWRGHADIAKPTDTTRPPGSIRRKETGSNIVAADPRSSVRRYGWSELLELVELHLGDELHAAVKDETPNFSAAKALERGPGFERLLELVLAKTDAGKLVPLSRGAGVRLPICPACGKKNRARLSFSGRLHCFGKCPASDNDLTKKEPGLRLEDWADLVGIDAAAVQSVRKLIREQRQAERAKDAAAAEGPALVPVGTDKLTRSAQNAADFESLDIPRAIHAKVEEALAAAAAGKSALLITPTGTGKSTVARKIIARRIIESGERFVIAAATHQLLDEYRQELDGQGFEVRHLKGIASACAFKEAAVEVSAMHWRWTVCPACPLRSTCEAMIRPTETAAVLLMTFEMLEHLKAERSVRGRTVILDEMPGSVTTDNLTASRFRRTLEKPELLRTVVDAVGFYGPTTERRDDGSALTAIGGLVEMVVGSVREMMLGENAPKEELDQRRRHGFEVSRDELVAAALRLVPEGQGLDQFLAQFDNAAETLEQYATGQVVQDGLRQVFERALSTTAFAPRSEHGRALKELAKRFPFYATPKMLLAVFRALRGPCIDADVSLMFGPERAVVVDPTGSGEADLAVEAAEVLDGWTFEVRRRRRLPRGSVVLDATGLLTLDELRAIVPGGEVEVFALDVDAAPENLRVWMHSESVTRTSMQRMTPDKFLGEQLRNAIAGTLERAETRAVVERYRAAGRRVRVSILTFKDAADRLRDDLADGRRLEVLELLGLDPDLFELDPERIGHYGRDSRGINRLDGDLLIEAGDPRGNLLATRADARVLGLDPDRLTLSRMHAEKAQASARVRWIRRADLPKVVVSVGSIPPAGWSRGSFVAVLKAPGRPATIRSRAKDALLELLAAGQEVAVGRSVRLYQNAYKNLSSTHIGTTPLEGFSAMTIARAADELVEDGAAEWGEVPRPNARPERVLRLSKALRQPLAAIKGKEQEAAEDLARVALTRSGAFWRVKVPELRPVEVPEAVRCAILKEADRWKDLRMRGRELVELMRSA